MVQIVSPTFLWKLWMANLNSEAILASPSYMCARERKLHTRVRLASLGSGSDMAARLPFAVLFFLVASLLRLRDMEGLVGLRIRSRPKVVGSPIYTLVTMHPREGGARALQPSAGDTCPGEKKPMRAVDLQLPPR